MTPIERLEAAIAKLEELKAISDDDAASAIWHVEPAPSWGSDVISTYPHSRRRDVIVERAYTGDADLMVTLHRTIDAQLAILRAAWSADYDFEYMRGDYKGRGPLKVTPLGIAAVALADAILGGDS